MTYDKAENAQLEALIYENCFVTLNGENRNEVLRLYLIGK